MVGSKGISWGTRYYRRYPSIARPGVISSHQSWDQARLDGQTYVCPDPLRPHRYTSKPRNRKVRKCLANIRSSLENPNITSSEIYLRYICRIRHLCHHTEWKRGFPERVMYRSSFAYLLITLMFPSEWWAWATIVNGDRLEKHILSAPLKVRLLRMLVDYKLTI